jgi:hypothetical protein
MLELQVAEKDTTFNFATNVAPHTEVPRVFRQLETLPMHLLVHIIPKICQISITGRTGTSEAVSFSTTGISCTEIIIVQLDSMRVI